MSEIRDVKDRTPNQETINLLRRLLEEAEAGELRTIIMICGDDEDRWIHYWSIDERNTFLRMLGAVSMLHFDLQTNEAIRDTTSILYRNLEGEP